MPGVAGGDALNAGERSTVSVFIAAEARFYREGIECALARDPRVRVMGTAGGKDDVIASLGRRIPDVVIVDARLAGGPPAIREIVRSTRAKVVAAGLEVDEDAFGGLARAGIRGFVTRDDSLDALVREVLDVAEDGLPCSPRMAATLFDRLSREATDLPAAGSSLARLTAREEEILDLIGEDLSNREIAERLCIQPATVKNHVHNILEKLQVDRRQEAVRRRPSAVLEDR